MIRSVLRILLPSFGDKSLLQIYSSRMYLGLCTLLSEMNKTGLQPGFVSSDISVITNIQIGLFG